MRVPKFVLVIIGILLFSLTLNAIRFSDHGEVRTKTVTKPVTVTKTETSVVRVPGKLPADCKVAQRRIMELVDIIGEADNAIASIKESAADWQLAITVNKLKDQLVHEKAVIAERAKLESSITHLSEGRRLLAAYLRGCVA